MARPSLAGAQEALPPSADTPPSADIPPSADALPPAPSPPGTAPASSTIEVVVSATSAADRLRDSADAVKVVETKQARKESADLGEVLARTPGVGVQRTGGLGSGSRFSLNGLTDDQIRFFLDGVPLEYAGYPFGIANLPVNAVERVEVYSGVVPVRFGADALGGAVNIVTPRPRPGAHAAASYQSGSFDTHRATLNAQILDLPRGLSLSAGGFADVSRNDYPIDVEVPNEVGRLEPARVRRFHDRYRALGANLEAGWRGRPWASHLLLRAFITDTDQDLQHNAVMTVPYGGVTFGERSAGGNVRYALSFGDGFWLDSVTGYAYARSRLIDVDTCAYDWFGRCVVERRPGELQPGDPSDALNWEHAIHSRTQLGWEPLAGHELLLAISPNLSSRSGDERLQTTPESRDPLDADRDLFTLVNGLEYTVSALEGRLENRVFVKQYLQRARAEDEVAENVFVDRDRSTHRYGVGNGVRFRISEQLYAKASYEWATRLPSADEVFGDNALVRPYLELRPETGHNLNLGLTGNAGGSASGDLRGELVGFWREADDLIVQLAEEVFRFYRNVFSARSLGVEASAGWTAPGGWLSFDVNATYQSFRNTSDDGLFVAFDGDRIPNRPWLFGNAALRLSRRQAFAPDDELALIGYARYVHEFLRGWESIGVAEYKQVVPGYVLTSLGASYTIQSGSGELTSSIEMTNLSDALVQDFYGVQRSRRAVSAKLTARY